MIPKRCELITCPKCGHQYLPAEIFIPKAFIGNPYGIERDYNGAIIEYEGASLDLFETYQCDNCDTLFKISARISFSTSTDEDEGFEEEYISPLNKNQLFSEEE